MDPNTVPLRTRRANGLPGLPLGRWVVFGKTLAFFGVLAGGCGSPPKPVVSDLRFPVLVIFPGAGHESFNDATSLHDMSMQRVLMHKDVPLLIDSDFRIFHLTDLKSTKSGLSIMVSGGVGRTPVSFTLTSTSDAGIAAARAVVQRHSSGFQEGSDAERRRERLAKAETIPELIEAIRGEL
jgi:hypothetical protein